MRSLILLSLVFFSANTFASTLANIKNFTSETMNNTQKAVTQLELVNYSANKKVTVFKASGKDDQEKRLKTVAQAIHTLCPFFDEGVALALTTKDDAGFEDVKNTFNNYSVDSTDVDSLVKILKGLNNSNEIEVYNGEASGNNTVGAVMGIYDTKNQEIFAFASTNCGSDD